MPPHWTNGKQAEHQNKTFDTKSYEFYSLRSSPPYKMLEFDEILDDNQKMDCLLKVYVFATA